MTLMTLLRSLGLIVLLVFHAGPVFALWCGESLIMEDQSRSEVERILEQDDCGEWLSAEKMESVREIVRWREPFLHPGYGIYGHPFHRHGGYFGTGWRTGIGRIDYASQRVEKWHIRVKNRQGIPYCHDLIFRSGILRAIGIGEECGSPPKR